VTPLRWGVIGASDIASTRVVPALRRLGQEPIAVLSGSSERGTKFAVENDIRLSYTSLDVMLDRDDIDAVYISTTNEQHAQQAIAAAAAGKHVLCEKPLAMSIRDAREIVSACERAGVVLATNHHLPAAGTHRKVRELVTQGAIGKPLAVRVFHAVMLPERLAGWRLTNPERGGGVILDITCHDAAAVHAILGTEALEVAAVACSQGAWEASAEDAVITAMRFPDDVLVQTHDAFTVGHADTGLEVHGTDGSIIARQVMTQDPIGSLHLRDRNGEQRVEPTDRRDLYDVTLEAFEGAVRGRGAPIVDGHAGLQALAVALAAKEAAETGRTVAVDAALADPRPHSA
jgi:1,5-anhydro-D-fructose reductase (1,5-anhydro-D-mannitol-forming)